MDWAVGGCVDGWVGVGWVGVWLAGGVGPAALRQRGIRPAGGVSRDPLTHAHPHPSAYGYRHEVPCLEAPGSAPFGKKRHAEVIVLRVTMRMNTKTVQHQYM